MSLWDSITGRKPASPSPSSATPPSSPSPPSDTFSDPEPSASPSPPPSSSPSPSPSPNNALLLPDPAALHPLANVSPTGLDYLTLDESLLSDLPGARTSAALPSRGWTDDLCYGTGVTYVTALGLGGAWGLTEGLRRTPAAAPPRLRLNGVLNSVTRRGPFLGNAAGVVALAYNLLNSGLGSVRGRHDAVNSVAAGFASGALFKSTRGLQPMLISGGLVAGAAGAWTVSIASLNSLVAGQI